MTKGEAVSRHLITPIVSLACVGIVAARPPCAPPEPTDCVGRVLVAEAPMYY